MHFRQWKRREFMTLLGGAAVASPLSGHAQGEQMHRIGVLIAGLMENDSEGQLRMAAFRRGLQNLGWDRRSQYPHRGALAGWECRAPAKLCCRVVGMRPDAIFAGNEEAMMALQPTASSLPIVFAQVSDPVAPAAGA